MPDIPLHRALRPAALAAVALLAVSLLSCETPEEVAKFCTTAVKAVKTGGPLLDDMQASCVRVAESREDFAKFAKTDLNPPACINVGKQADGLKAASKVLEEYFSSVKELAAFGTTKAGADAGTLAGDVAAQAKMADGPTKSVAAIGGFLTKLATSGYQRKHLADDLGKVQPDIQVALHGLAEAVGTAYLHQLDDEEQKTVTRYRGFLLEHPAAADAPLILDARWANDRAAFDAKRKVIEHYKKALETLAKANTELASHAHGLQAKELGSLLSDYSEQVESLVPVIQKAFF